MARLAYGDRKARYTFNKDAVVGRDQEKKSKVLTQVYDEHRYLSLITFVNMREIKKLLMALKANSSVSCTLDNA